MWHRTADGGELVEGGRGFQFGLVKVTEHDGASLDRTQGRPATLNPPRSARGP
jgi:hypothetical protein